MFFNSCVVVRAMFEEQEASPLLATGIGSAAREELQCPAAQTGQG